MSCAPTTLHLIDGSGFIFRAFHALPPLNRPDGIPVNAVLGFTSMLVRLRAETRTDALLVVFDAQRENFRNTLYPAYKAHRPPPPEELVPQFALIREAVAAFSVPCIEMEGYEADDLIATYARLAREAGWEVRIQSSDKDLMQLVREGVRLHDPLKNRSIGPEEVLEKFGVPPEKVVDVQALAGDSVDNVPGVPGIGLKTAAQLIQEFGDLETLLAQAGAIRQPKRRENLLTFAPQARLSRQLVQLADQVPVTLPLEALQPRPLEPGRVRAFLETQGFRSLLNRFREDGPAFAAPQPAASSVPSPAASRQTPATASPVAILSPRYTLIQELPALDAWLAGVAEAGVLAVDTETTSLRPCTAGLVGISLAITPGEAIYIPVGHEPPEGGLLGIPPRQLPVAAVLERLKPILEDPAILKVGHNFKFDAQVFLQYGLCPAPLDDTLLISYVLDGSRHPHAMDALAERHLGVQTLSYDSVTGTGRQRIPFAQVSLERACAYAAEDADITLRLHRVLKPRLRQEKMLTLYETIERPLVLVVAAMERQGIRINPQVLAGLSQDFAVRLAALESGIHQMAGQSFNVGSPKQLGDVLFDKLGLSGSKKSKATGAWSTESAVLEPLAEQGVEIAARILDWRQLAKLKSTYTDTLPQQIDPRTGRIHTHFSLAVTNTGRLSSTDPNLQNIPIRSEEGRAIRKAFIADPGWRLVSVDYSQIELRLAAEIAGVETLKQAFREGQDIHARTAAEVFGVSLAALTPDLRRKAKAVNFGIIYGISGYGLSRQLGISPGEANAFIRRYFDRFPELQAYMERTRIEARQHGFVTTLFGRRCHLPGIHDRNPTRRAFAERQAINAPLQGTAADIIKRAMVALAPALERAGLAARLLLQVHDELVLEVPEDEVAATIPCVRTVMEGAASLSIPLVAEAGVGENWAEAH